MVIQAVVLGIIEGLTEFLPISSTGHLIIANTLIQFTGEFANTFDVVIQIGAICAVILYFRKRLFSFAYATKEPENSLHIWKKVIIGFLPSALVGVLFADSIEQYLFNPTTVAIALIAGGAILLVTEKLASTSTTYTVTTITYKQAFIVGLFQCIALIPGTSRSAATIIGGLYKGFSREAAAEFSFMLAIPTLFAAATLKLLNSEVTFTSSDILLLIIGTIVSFITALIVISILMNYLKKHTFAVFGWYRIVVGIVVLLFIH
jgi:undecaprenyl-diphosphatase